MLAVYGPLAPGAGCGTRDRRSTDLTNEQYTDGGAQVSWLTASETARWNVG